MAGSSPIIHYFAYGSNMNPARMRARGIVFTAALAGWMPGFGLRFDKRAHGKQHVAYANIAYAPQECVEGVLYQLNCAEDIGLMDPFEGSPYRYSREIFSVRSRNDQRINAWVYVANRALLADGLLPERRYLDHLLAGQPWQSESYHRWLQAQPCIDSQASNSGDKVDGLIFNV